MKQYLQIAVRIYRRISIAFLIGYLIYVVYDDFVLIRRISTLGELSMALGIELIYLGVYFMAFTFFYVMTALVVIMVSRFDRP